MITGRLHCIDCGVDSPTVFMVHNELFLSVCQKRDLICLECFEVRIGRQVLPKDLKECGLVDVYRLYHKIMERA